MSAGAVRKYFDRAQGSLNAARAASDAGQLLDLGELGKAVDAACHAVTELPAPEAKSFEAPLKALFDDLNALAAKLGDEYSMLRTSLGDLNKHRKAQSAYTKPAYAKPARAKPGPGGG